MTTLALGNARLQRRATSAPACAANTPLRLSRGGRIDRTRPLEFTFNGRTYAGFAGDTLASALLANGVDVVARSIKYHRPRGIVAAGTEEPNAIVQVGAGAFALPNQRATQVELHYGLQAHSVNAWPTVDFDLQALAGAMSRLMPAGFYYKTFMWPSAFWMRYEHIIRRAAGLGYAPTGPDPDAYETLNAHCDVLVVGAGPAGLAAALAAGRSGARVILADEQNEAGGSLLGSHSTINAQPAMAWVAKAAAELDALAEVTVLARTTAFGYYDHNFVGLLERLTDHLPPGRDAGPRQRRWRVRARQVVIAAGAHERPLVFANNDRPGIMLASAVSTYIHRYAVRPGTRAVVFANNDSAYRSALDLADAGAAIEAIVDARPCPSGPLPAQARARGMRVEAGSAVVNAIGAKRVQAVDVMRLGARGDGVEGSSRRLTCDLLAVSGGWSPAVHLHSQSGGRARFDATKACFVPGDPVQAERSAGACKATFDLGECLTEGFAAGTEAARACGFNDAPEILPPAIEAVDEHALKPLWLVPAPKSWSGEPKRFVDLQNDTTAADIELAAREGYRSIEHVKRYTALGFGTDQGKLGNINGMAILAKTLGQDISATGTTTFRPAYTPVTLGAFAGRDVAERFDPVRKTALHAWHEAHGARFENVGQWRRPHYYPRAGETLDEAVQRECLAVHNGIGILDYSTLGKIEVRGPDAAELLNRVYTNRWDTLAVGRCKYGVMLGEDGMVMDDGVTTRLGDHRFLMTTSTGNAAKVLAWLERWLQTEWPQLKVYLTSVTDHWATISLAGPSSRSLMCELCSDIDFSAEAFPFFALREGSVVGVPARAMRVSFSGELSYEVSVPANYARHVWEAAMQAGEAYGITPYGTETMHVLRADKGFIIVGQDTDGSVTPTDLGMDWILAKDKDFIGRRSLARPDCRRGDRKQLVGLLTETPDAVLQEGAQLVEQPRVATPVPMLGHVSSSYYSARMQRAIALALVKGGRARHGESVYACSATGQPIKATIASPVFFDPEGVRQRVRSAY